ncbi:hypothetical protein EDB84DRAFT_1572115 [Lactarius hengduanensis]|nr:hypothetical protein EDB84DRAFT_1572115 [Lactarius hengduanensis]
MSGCLDRSVRFPDPPFLVSAIFLTTLSIRCLFLAPVANHHGHASLRLWRVSSLSTQLLVAPTDI